MKTKKKAFGLVLAAVLLVCVSVLGTVAYLTSTDSVNNTFTVGNVAITLDEAPVDAQGKATNETRVKANSYKLMPGHEYDKDPTVHVDAISENCWLFVKVENGITAIEDETKIADQITGNGWKALDGVDGVYYMEYKQTDEKKDKVVFENFKVKDKISNEDLAKYGNAKIIVTAYAVQADGFDTAADAWAATFGASTQSEGN